MLIENDASVVVKADVGAVGTPTFLVGANDHSLDDLATLDRSTRDRILDSGNDDIADAGNSIRNDIEQSIDPDGDMADEFKEDFDLADDDDPFLKEYAGEDEDDELDDIDPKYQTAEQTAEEGPGDAEPAETEPGETEPVETVKKA